jgi:membrane protein
MFLFRKIRGLTFAQLRSLFSFAAKRLDEDRLPQVAGSLTFTTVLSLVPIITVALAIFSAFPLFSTFRTALEEYLVQNMLPSTGVAKTIMGYLNQFATKSASLSAVGGVALIFTSALTIATIEQAFNQIWRVKKTRPLVHRVLVYWAIITLGPLLVGVSITLTSYFASLINVAVDGFPMIASTFSVITSIFLGTIAFTALYMLIPNQQVNWRDAFWGGLMASIVIEIAKKLFTLYIIKLPTYTVVYGALAVLPIFLMWIYMMWMITLIGAVIAAALPVVKHERWWHVSTPGGEFVDAMIIIMLLREARTKSEIAAVDLSLIRQKTRLGSDDLQSIMQKMVDAGWVGSLRDELPRKSFWKRSDAQNQQRWVLLANPDVLRISDIYRMFVFNSEAHSHQDFALIDHIEHSMEELLSQSINAYFEEHHVAEKSGRYALEYRSAP